MTDYNLLAGLSEEATQEELLGLLDIIADRIGVLTAVRQQDGSLRVSVTTGTLSTVTTVSTVVNQQQYGGYPTQQIVPAQQNTTAYLSNIAQIIVS